MVSLKKAMDGLAECEAQLKAALLAYTGTIESLVECALPAPKDVADRFRKSLETIPSLVRENPSPDVVGATAAQVRIEIDTFYERAEEAFRRMEKAIKELILAMAEASQTLTAQNSQCDEEFRDFARRIEVLAEVNDIGFIRRQLTENFLHLKQWMDNRLRESQQTVDRMKAQMRTSQKSLEQAQSMAFEDPLTGIGNRRAAETEIAEKLKGGVPFCLGLFDVDHFKQINDEFGHQAGDDVLRKFAECLKNNFRSADAVYRWGGDEFVVILPYAAEGSILREDRVSSIGFKHSLSDRGQMVGFEVTASAGCVECEPGDTVEALFSRADRQLYERKRSTRTEPGTGSKPASKGKLATLFKGLTVR